VLIISAGLVGCGSTALLDDDAGPSPQSSMDASSLDTPDASISSDAGGVVDAGSSTRANDAGLSGVLIYPTDRKHSPMTADVVEHLRSIAALSTTKKANVFSKVGDSNTVNTNYLGCFAGTNVDLAGRTTLDPALAFFRSGMVGTTTSFDRTTLAATIGWSAFSALAGTPSPLQQEIDAAQPRYATVMFGTNDVGFMDPSSYGRNLMTIVDTLSMQGVVPLISSVPPRDDDPVADLWVARYNLVARGVAQARKVPFIDVNRELLPVAGHGLGPDGIHLNVYVPSSVRGCVFTPAGLGFGHNVRNLATLEGLSRAWSAVSAGTVPDPTAPLRSGTGLPGAEIAITALPFVDFRDTRTDGLARLDSYPGCASTANESGREVLYRLDLAQPTNVRIFVVSLGNADIDVHLLSDTASGQSCIARNDKVITRALPAGTSWLSLDTYQSTTGVLAGEYVLVVMLD
jgi:hypothetical protein